MSRQPRRCWRWWANPPSRFAPPPRWCGARPSCGCRWCWTIPARWARRDSTGTSKISALKDASHQLLTILQNAASTAGDVQVAIMPFAKDVNVGTGYVNASWIDWTIGKPAALPPRLPVRSDREHCPWHSNGCVTPARQHLDDQQIRPAAPTKAISVPVRSAFERGPARGIIIMAATPAWQPDHQSGRRRRHHASQRLQQLHLHRQRQ